MRTRSSSTLSVSMKKMWNSSPRPNSRLVSPQRRSDRIQCKGVPKYTCDNSSDESESKTSLVAKTRSCKIATYSRKTTTKYKKPGGIDNPKQLINHFASASPSKIGINQPMVICDTNNAEEILLPIWWGSLSIGNDNFGNVGVCAVNKSTRLSSKAFYGVTLLPTQMIPRHDAWPNCFDTSPPTDGIIDLYFLPASESDNQLFGRLLDYMYDQDFAIRAAVGDTRLLLFSSRILPHKYWRYEDKYYLWAVIIGENASFPHPQESLVSPNAANEVDNAVIDESLEPYNVENNANNAVINGRDCLDDHVARDCDKEPGQNDYSKSFCTSWIGVAHNLEDESLDEINSAADCGELVGQYHLKTCFASTLRSIIEKHGEITQNCNTTPSGLVTFVLEKICRVVQDFKVLDLKDLRPHHLSSLQTVIDESEHINVNVKWLKSFHGELSEASNKMKDYEKLKLSKQSRMKEIKSKEVELMNLQSQIQSLKDDNERFEDDLSRARGALKGVRPNSLMDGLL
ncbi:uncharacterized protein LOC133803593 [Humulus lupulus]|uniref:uncharacterized protein LOC133803593 n=1 Tax=Humulus lupulus TaxID=3486 RepID=UPI002B405A27|nr:uncharacterized protein LOC133803593 [Humulus lupulus]